MLLRSLVRPLALLTVAVAPFFAGEARAQWSSASVFTEDGVELGVEPRIFSLFAILNSVGYDKETLFGPAPLEKPQYSAAREKLRSNLGRSSVKELGELFQKNPAPLAAYIQAVLELGPAPRFDDKAATSPLARALAGPLREWFNEEGGSALLRNANEEARATQRRLLPLLDRAITGVTKTARLGDSSDQLLEGTGSQGRVAIVLNDLDAHGSFLVVNAGDTTAIITGPLRGTTDDDAVIDAATLAYARTVVAGETDKLATAGTLVDGFAKLGAATKAGLPDGKRYARELLACGLAREIRARAVPCPLLDGDDEAKAALALMAPRVAQFAGTTALLAAALGDLFAAPPPPPPPPPETPPEEPKKKKKGKG
jgi:hypothetical protein